MEPERDPKRPRALLWILVLSTLIKLAILPAVADMEQKADERQYVAAAPTIVETGVPVYPNENWDEAHAAPGMPYFLAGCYAIAGEDGFKTLARFVQVVLSIFTVLIAHAIARRIGAGPRTALLAAALVAFNPTQIAFTHYFWAESVYTFFSTWAVWLLLRSQDGERGGKLAYGAGIVGGLATLTRGLFITQVPLVMAWLVFGGSGPRKRRLACAALFLLGVLTSVLPWSARNTMRYGSFLFVSSNGGAVLAKGANPIRPENHDLGLTGWSEELRAYTNAHAPDYEGVIPMRPRYMSDDLVEQNNVRTRDGLRFMLSHPALTIDHARIRLQYLVNPTSFLIRHIREGYYGELPAWFAEPLILLTLLASMVVMALFIIGLIANTWDRDKALIVLMVMGSLSACALVAAVSRYRVPIVPLMVPYAAIALVSGPRLREAVRGPVFWLVGAPVLAFLAFVWTQYLPFNYS